MSPDPLATRIVVSIVNYGASDMVLANLPGVLEELARFAEGVVYVVDNASPDGDGAALEAGVAAMGSPEGVHLILSPRNGGFAAGNNLVFAAMKDLDWTPDAVLLLNPDSLLRPGAIVEMVRVMRARSRVGVVGARLENEDGTSWVAAFHFPTPMVEFAREFGLAAVQRRWPALIEDADVPVRADWVSGACMLINARLIDEIGPLDEEYFLYFEEVDFQLQAHRAGWETWHAPQALVMHVAGTATGIVDGAAKEGPMPAYWFASWRRYFEKNHGAFQARAAAVAKLAGIVLGTAQRRLRGKPEQPQPPGFVGDFARSCLLRRGAS